MPMWYNRVIQKRGEQTMIKREITVGYSVRKSTGQVALSALDLLNPGEKYTDVFTDIIDTNHHFDLFKNNGEVSKTCRCKYDIVNKEAERLLKEQLKTEQERPHDQERANELASIVNKAFAADGDQDFRTIKVKSSHSKWYSNDYIFNSPSTYLYQVPLSVLKQAKELQAIRRKHQEDVKFNFLACDYQTRVVRIADHDNGDYSADECYDSYEAYNKAHPEDKIGE